MTKKRTTRHNNSRKRGPQPRAAAPPNAVVIETAHPRWMGVRDACRYGGFGRSIGYALIREHKIIAVKLGRRTLIDVASIDAFIATLPRVGQ